MASVSKEFHRLLKRIGKLTDGQASIADIDWDDGELKNFYVTITPNNGFYKSGRFRFEVKLPDEYPVLPPIVWCHTDIYHPNIDPTEENYSDSSTNVCLNVLEAGTWSSSFGLEGAILGLLFLMHNPNLGDPLSPHFDGNSFEEYFPENVKKYMAGEDFDDLSFDKDFKVIDGVLIDDTVPSSETQSNNEAIITDTVENLKEVNNLIKTTDMKLIDENTTDGSISENMNGRANCTAYEEIDKYSVNNGDSSNFEKPVVQFDENNDKLRQGEACSQEAGEMNDQVDSSDRDIELVNIDGDCVFLVHRYISSDEEILANDNGQEPDNTSNATQNESVTINSATGYNNSQNEVSNSDIIAINSEVNSIQISEDSTDNCGNNLCSSTTTNNVCNIEARSNEITTSQHDESKIKDNRSHDNSKGCGCGAWYTFRMALGKIVYSLGHNKIYRDIGL